MAIDPETKQLLLRWQALGRDDELRRAKLISRLMWLATLIGAVLVYWATTIPAQPVVIAGGALLVGALADQTNGLHWRIDNWPVFQRYLDWERIDADLAASEEHSS